MGDQGQQAANATTDEERSDCAHISIAGEAGVIDAGHITLDPRPDELRLEIAGERGEVGEGVVRLEDNNKNGSEGRDDGDDGFDIERPEVKTEPKTRFITNHFLFFYLRSLFPTRKELDYGWEWNPCAYLQKFLALEETGKNRSKHKQNYPYPFVVILYCWYHAFLHSATASVDVLAPT
jgi:hypothetical protein